MEKLIKIWDLLRRTKIINSIIVIFISIFIYKCIFYLINKNEKKNKSKFFTDKKSRTYLNLIKNLIRYVFIIITFLLLLQINGIDITSVLAGVGVFGVVFGLAIQDWLKDIIRGSSILSDNYFSVGDIVKYNESEGKVLIIGLKTTKIQDLKTGNVISIANRNIEEIEVVSNLVYVNIPMPYELSVEKAEKTIEEIVNDIKKGNNVKECLYKGVNELADSSINYLIEITCNPINKLQVRRDALRTILIKLNDNNIKVPYTQIDIHEK